MIIAKLLFERGVNQQSTTNNLHQIYIGQIMPVRCSGSARIQHKATNTIYEIDSDDLDWDTESDDDARSMGGEIRHESIIEHPALGILAWRIWEYPEGIENTRDTDVGGHNLISNLTFELRQDEPEPDDWADWEDFSVPDDPHSIFMESYTQSMALLADHGRGDGTYLLNRLIFSQQVTSLEVYLGDTIFNVVTNNSKSLLKLIEDDEDLKKQKYTLPEIIKNNDIVYQNVKKYLRSIMYHNIAKVDAIYFIVFGFRIIDPAADRKKLFDTFALRHDCVHRNGHDKDGQKLDVFDKSFVEETADLVRDFVQSIEDKIRDKYVEEL